MHCKQLRFARANRLRRDIEVRARCHQQGEAALTGRAVRAALPEVQYHSRRSHQRQAAGSVKLGSVGSVTDVSRSIPSFSSLMCWMATALAFASRSGNAWYSETQQRNT